MGERIIHCLDCKVEPATVFLTPHGTKLYRRGYCETCHRRAVRSPRRHHEVASQRRRAVTLDICKASASPLYRDDDLE